MHLRHQLSSRVETEAMLAHWKYSTHCHPLKFGKSILSDARQSTGWPRTFAKDGLLTFAYHVM